MLKTTFKVANFLIKAYTIAEVGNKFYQVLTDDSTSNTEKVKKIIQIISTDDLNYLANQSTTNLNSIFAQMSGLINENNVKIEQLESQLWYTRIIKTVFGTNKATKEDIRKNHEKLNMYMAQATSELFKMNCIDHKIMISLANQINNIYKRYTALNNKVNELSEELLILRDDLNAFVDKLNKKIESVDNFHILHTEISQGVYSKYMTLEAIFTILSQIDNRTLTDSRKIGIIERSLLEQGVLNDEKIKLSDLLIDVKNISYDNISIIYMDQLNTREHFLSSLILNLTDSQNLLLGNGYEYADDKSIIKELIESEQIDNSLELSTHDIYNQLIQAKIDKLNSLCPVSELQYKAMLISAQDAFLEYDMEYAEFIFNILAEKNVSEAMYFLYLLYNEGYGNVEKNTEKANYWLKKGSDNNEPFCSFEYALTLDDDKYINTVLENIFDYMLNLAEEGNVFAQTEISIMYLYKDYTNENTDKFLYWLNKAVNNGYFLAIRELAQFYYEGFYNEDTIVIDQDTSKAYKLFKKAADIGDYTSLFMLGIYHYESESVDKNYEEAINFYKKSAEQGFAPAKYELSRCYYNGEGIIKNFGKAFKFCLKAAEEDDVNAQSFLGYLYMNGIGTSKNSDKAINWWKKAAKKNDINALLELGYCHLTNIIKPKSEAFNYFKKAAELNDAEGQKKLADCYRDGIGTKVDYKKAKELYLKAANQGNVPAMTNIGWLYYHGKGVTKNIKESISWYKKGAEGGSANSQYSLANFYRIGEGVEKDPQEAIAWYMKSAKQGNTYAKKALKKYYKIKL